MYTVEQRLARIEKQLSLALRMIPEKTPRRMKEKDVCIKYDISASRLKQLRLGCIKNGVKHPPVLFNWASIKGRRIDYEIAELEKLFQRTGIAG